MGYLHADNELYQKLKVRFDALMNTDTKVKQEESRRNHLNAVLNAILQDGLETAMEKYKKE